MSFRLRVDGFLPQWFRIGRVGGADSAKMDDVPLANYVAGCLAALLRWAERPPFAPVY
jgi:hypothetical protein